MSVAVVILNWNGVKLLETFLPKVLEYSLGARVIVADNASTDSSIECISKTFPQVEVISNDKNYGFAGGYNKSLANVDDEYLLLLNSDVEVTAGWLEPLVEMMKSDALVAACQPKILSWHERSKFEYAGAAGGFIDRLGYPFCRGRMFDTLESDHGQYNDVREIFWATGACMMVRTEVFKKLGGFDESFFAHMEEIDLCWRMHNDGHKIMYVPTSTVYHVGGGTLNKYSSRKTYLNIRNNLMMLVKNLPDSEIFAVLFVRLVLDGVAALRFLFTGGLKHMFAVVRAHFSLYRKIRGLLRNRQKGINNYPAGVYQRNIVFEYFARGTKRFDQLNPQDFISK